MIDKKSLLIAMRREISKQQHKEELLDNHFPLHIGMKATVVGETSFIMKDIGKGFSFLKNRALE